MVRNTAIDTLLQRRSYKHFDGQEISDEAIEAIVAAGLRAPSGMNRQPWHITVVKSPKMLERIYQALCETPGPGGEIMLQTRAQALRNAPVLVFVSTNDAVVRGMDAGLEAGLVTENMLIAAASMGIMGGWAHVFVWDFFQNPAGAALKPELIPEGYTVQSGIFYGYPAEERAERVLAENTVTIIR